MPHLWAANFNEIDELSIGIILASSRTSEDTIETKYSARIIHNNEDI
jgi:hypothetical protein